MLRVHCFDGTTRLCQIRGTMRRREWVNKSGILQDQHERRGEREGAEGEGEGRGRWEDKMRGRRENKSKEGLFVGVELMISRHSACEPEVIPRCQVRLAGQVQQ